LRVAGIEFEFLAEAAHLRVDAAVETCRRTTARQIEKLVAIEHTLRSLDQRDQQIVFAGAQRHRDTIIAQERACAGVQTPAVEMVTLGFLLGVSLRQFFLAAAQDRFNPRHQFSAAERFREVIALLIEDSPISRGLIQSLREKSINVTPYKPDTDKRARVIAQSDLFAGGSVRFPRRAGWLEDLTAELLAFPGRHDDQVDALIQALAWNRSRRGEVSVSYVRY
jgi:predicted phage terminase large subunit-like protein